MAILIQKISRRRLRGASRGMLTRARMALVLGLTLAGAWGRAESISREYPLKAAFLLNFAQLTTWPTNSFHDTNSPIIVGIIGDPALGEAVAETLRGELCNGHPFVVRTNPPPDETPACHILLVSRLEVKKLRSLADRLKGLPVLTVGDFETPERQTMIRLFTENNRIRFQVNLDLVKDSNLAISSKLLRVAQVESPRDK